MARILAIVLSTLLALTIAVSAARSFEETKYIDMVTDKIQDLESSIFKILGTNPKSLQFAEFALRYGKRYDSVRQIVHRFNAFVKNVELIESRNSMKLPYTLAINEFADMTWEEFHGQYLGASQNCSATKGNHKLTDAQVPVEKDWRGESIVSPVKNQAHCGSCWTFSTTGALEAAYTQATGKTVILSEQQLVDCAGAFNNFGCNGGLPSQAFEYIKYNGGLDTEEAYPYTAKDGVCKYDANKIGVKVAGSVNISLGAEDELKSAVGLVRPVSVAFQVIQEFRFYKEGVFTSTTCGQGPMDVNHAVLAVGYGVSEEGTPHWIIKNSWGKSWGVEGYFKMEMGKNMCVTKKRKIQTRESYKTPSLPLNDCNGPNNERNDVEETPPSFQEEAQQEKHDDVHEQSCHEDINIEGDDSSTHGSVETVKKKCRGPTRCANINSLEAKLEIHCNERNQPIGPNSMKLASLLGVLAREMVPITYFDWRKVLIQLKEDFWSIINETKRKNKQNREKEKDLHTCGRRGYQRVEDDMDQDNTIELPTSPQLRLEGKKCYLIVLKSRVKVARATIHTTDPNSTSHCVRLGEDYYIVNPTEILEPKLGTLPLPHPNSEFSTIEDSLWSFIPWHKDNIELCD